MFYLRTFLCTVLIITLVGCGGQGGNVAQTRSDSSIILGHNTDPRFSIIQQNDVIGAVWPAGDEVYLNQQNINNRSTLKNFDHVHTGDDSAAKIDFYKNTAQCDILISDYQYGRLYGHTKECHHKLETPQAIAQAMRGNAEYNIEVSGHRSRITVISGALKAASIGDPAATIEIPARSEALINRNRIQRLNKLTDAELGRRIQWLNRYKFHKDGGSGAGTAAAIGVGIIGALILKEIFDNDKDDNRPDQSGSNNNDNIDPDKKPTKKPNKNSKNKTDKNQTIKPIKKSGTMPIKDKATTQKSKLL